MPTEWPLPKKQDDNTQNQQCAGVGQPSSNIRWLGRDNYREGLGGLDHCLYECKPKWDAEYQRFRHGGRYTVLTDDEVSWLFPDVQLELGQAVPVVVGLPKLAEQARQASAN